MYIICRKILSILSSDTDSDAAFNKVAFLLPPPLKRPSTSQSLGIPTDQDLVDILKGRDPEAESIFQTLKITGLRADEVKNIP